MRVDAFSESYSENGGFIRGMDSRAKLLVVIACLLLSVASSNPVAPLIVGAVCLALTLASGAPLLSAMLRLAEPLIFVSILAVLRAFLAHGDALSSLHTLGVPIISRVFGAVSSVLFLTMTTPVNRLLSASAWFRTPKAFVEILMFAYRYVFVLIEDTLTVYHAQKGRLGYAGFRRGIRSLSTLAGSVFLRAFNQAEATSSAMAIRGYTGEYLPECRESFRPADAAFLMFGFVICLSVYLWTL